MLEEPLPFRGGVGEPLVLIHGGGGTCQQWMPVVPHLTDRHDVLAVNLIGHWGGRPPDPAAEATVDLLADGVEADMDAAGLDRAHIVGTSLGGLVALVLARRGRAATCTGLATIGGWENGGEPRLRLVGSSYRLFHRTVTWMAKHPERWTTRRRLRRLLFWHHFADTDQMDPAETARLLVGFANCTILGDHIDWARTHDGPSGFEAIACPVQILFAEHDHVFPKSRFGPGLRAALPQAEFHDLPGVGHVATWDDPGLVAASILRFTYPDN